MISTYNEWDPLCSIVVGDILGANWPHNDPVFAREMAASTWTESAPPQGPVPAPIIEQTNLDLHHLINSLVQHGVEVTRPQPMDFVKDEGLYNYCPRDRLLVWGDTIVDCARMYPCRDQEVANYPHVLAQAGRVLTMPRDQGMILDAANVMRLNDTWLFLESASGNRAAYNWLCDNFPDVKIELCNFYAGVHIDSSITPLREGLVLLNGSRIDDSNCPRAFDRWEKIYITDVVPQSFYQFPYASKWIAMNMLVVDPNTVIVDAAQDQLIQLLLSRNFSVIPLTLTHSRTLGGGFHCVTLDLIRSSDK